MEQEHDRILTMSELVKDGYCKEFLYRVAHMKETPFFRTQKRGKFYVLESKFKEFIGTRRVGK